MSEPFLGEIRLFGTNYAPQGWALCEGQLLPISQYQALYALLGTVYGGDGRTTFALPDLRGRVPIHSSYNFPLGVRQGEEMHTLTTSEMPSHTHQVECSTNDATSISPQDNIWAKQANKLPYGPETNMVQMNQGAVSTTGSSQAHSNMQPFLVLNYCIALTGIFPTRN